MRTAYFDAFSGLSGDMVVGALLDSGADFAALEQAIASLGLSGYKLATERKTLSGISALKFNVDVLAPQPERHLSEIETIIKRGKLEQGVKDKALTVFVCLARAEAKVHHTTPERVHFHEVGAVDSIIDIVGASWALERLKVHRILVSPLPMGTGFAHSQHGTIPVPPPATAELLEGFPVRLGDGESEMVTPTGAAILSALAKPAPLPLDFTLEKIGYGAGTKVFRDRPNVIRVMLGSQTAKFESDQMVEIQTNIDDLNPQIYDHLFERLLAADARDVTLTPTIMKKGRPGITVSVLAETHSRDTIAGVLFAETTTIGLRYRAVERLKLEREVREVDTRWGRIRVKVAHGGDGAMNFAPEFDDCRRAAVEHGVALKLVIQDAHASALSQLK